MTDGLTRAIRAEDYLEAETLCIRVSANRFVKGTGGWWNPSKRRLESLATHVHIRVFSWMNLERFEDAVEAAENDPGDPLEAALILKAQAEAAAVARVPWVEATPSMIDTAHHAAVAYRALQTAEEGSRARTDNSTKTRRSKRAALDPVFDAAFKQLSGKKATIDRRALADKAWKIADTDNPALRDQVTERRARSWLERKKADHT